jgi:hypothetical protein
MVTPYPLRRFPDRGTICRMAPIGRIVISSTALACVAAACMLSAAMPAQSADKKLRGCWIKVQQQTQPLKQGQVQPYLEYCFRDDGRILGNYMESGGYGGDLEMKWSRVGRSMLKLDGERCTFEYIGKNRFLLADCMYESEWKLSCRNPKYPITCGK